MFFFFVVVVVFFFFFFFFFFVVFFFFFFFFKLYNLSLKVSVHEKRMILIHTLSHLHNKPHTCLYTQCKPISISTNWSVIPIYHKNTCPFIITKHRNGDNALRNVLLAGNVNFWNQFNSLNSLCHIHPTHFC